MAIGIRQILIFAGAVTVGVVGTVLVSKNKEKIKPLAANLLSRAMDAKDVVMSKVEVMKENMEDVVAEAKSDADKRREQKA